MIRTIIIILILFFSINIFAQPPDEPPNSYHIIFQDEFDTLYNNVITYWNDMLNHYVTTYNDVDMNKWLSVPGYYQLNYKVINGDTIRYEYAYSMKNFENAEIDTTGSGKINLITKQEDRICKYRTENWDQYWDTAHYTTQMLLSRNYFKYGYYEINFRIPQPANPMEIYGLSPNFWLYSRYNNPCLCSWSEIDIFEINGAADIDYMHRRQKTQHDPIAPYSTLQNGYFENYFTNTILYQYCEPSCNTCTDTTKYVDFDGLPLYHQGSKGSIFSDGKFHKFGMKWKPNLIYIYVDDILFSKYEYSYGNKLDPSLFIPMRIIVDVNVPAFNFVEVFDTAQVLMPYVYEVDYVKIWSFDDCGYPDLIVHQEPFIFYNNYDNSKIYNKIDISNNLVTNVYPGYVIDLKASKIIHLGPGFHAKKGSNFHAHIKKCNTIVE